MPCFTFDFSLAFNPALDPSGHRQPGEHRLTRMAPVREQPVHFMANRVTADLDPPGVGFDRLAGVEHHAVRRLVEQPLGISVNHRPVLLQRQAIIPAAVTDGRVMAVFWVPMASIVTSAAPCRQSWRRLYRYEKTPS